MSQLVRRLAPAGIVALALAVPAAASAAVTTVYAGLPPGVAKLVSKLHATSLKSDQPDLNAFVNQRATIHVGDSVSFQLRGFHTVDIPAAGGSDLPLISAGAKVTGVNDAAGNPFWFNGLVPSLGFNPLLFKPLGKTTYNGSARFDTGLPLGSGAPKPFLIKFTKAGTYRYFCDVHPGMIGYVTVKPKAAALPTAKQNAAAQLKQLTGDIKAAVKVAKTKPPANTVSLGQSTAGGIELYSMFPASLTVNAGTVVTFQMSKHTDEVHTATFGPDSVLKTLSNIGPGVAPQASYPSDPGQATESPTAHGDGFANTGFLDQDAGTKQIPASGKVLFTTPGTYHYICLIHPFMHGTIVVK